MRPKVQIQGNNNHGSAHKGPAKQKLLTESAGVQQLYWIRETLRLRRRGQEEEEAEHTPSLCPNYCVTVGLSPISLLPSTLIYPAATILYRPIWIKGERTEKRGRPKHERREEKWGKERCDGLWDSVLAAGFLASRLSCLIAQGDSVTRWDWLVRALIRRLQWRLAVCCYALVR